MALTIQGMAGELRWGYHEAALLENWTLTQGTLTATVIRMDPFRLAQQPLRFVVRHASGIWQRPVMDLDLRDGVVTARLSAPEEVSHGQSLSVRSA